MNLLLWTLTPVLVLGPALTSFAPRVMAPLFILCSLMTILASAWQRKSFPAFDKHLAMLFGGIMAFGLASYAWNINQEEVLGKVGQLSAVFGSIVFLAPIIREMSLEDLRKFGRLAFYGFGLGLGVYLFESFFNSALYNLTHPGNTDVPDVKHNKAAVLVSLWLLAVAPTGLLKAGNVQRLVFAGLSALTFFAVFQSQSETAQMIFAGLPFLILVLYFLPARIGMTLALSCVITLMVTMPFIATGIYKNTDWLNTTFIDRSLKSRLEIWNQASSRAFEKPIFGWGLDASPKLPNRDDTSLLYEENLPITHLHPHNAPIQIWFEMGLAGIAAFCGLFILLYGRLKKITVPMAQKYGAFFGSVLFLYTLAIWGIWQTWFIATLAFSGLMAYAGVRYLVLEKDAV